MTTHLSQTTEVLVCSRKQIAKLCKQPVDQQEVQKHPEAPGTSRLRVPPMATVTQEMRAQFMQTTQQ